MKVLLIYGDMYYSKDIIPVPGIQISVRMLTDDGAYILISNDDSEEVSSIYLPDQSLLTFASYIMEAAKKSKNGKEIY